MKVLVTGEFGFIGSRLIERLTDEGYTVSAHDRWLWASPARYERVLNSLNDVDAVFHVGAISDTMATDLREVMTLNFHATAALSNWCRKKCIPLIYSSSAAIEAAPGIFEGFDSPNNLYGWSKFAGEQIVLANNQVALRYFNVYGPGEEKKGRMASVACQAWMQRYGGNDNDFMLFANRPQRDFVYIDDVVDANLYALKNYSLLKANKYSVGSGKANTFERVMELINLSFDYHPTTAIPAGYQYHTCAFQGDFMPGWKPKYCLEDGITDYKNYLKKNYPL